MICHPGYAAIALDNPKFGENVGSALRAAHCYRASLVIIGGARRTKFLRNPTDTMKTYRHTPVQWLDDVLSAIPFDCVPVAVDLLDDAEPLPSFVHPDRALYVFGAEDATLGRRITDRCARKVYVPTQHCMNLAATVNVVLYDRMAKAASRMRAAA